MSAVSETVSPFDAENATKLTADFLKRLGYTRGLRAIKVSLEEETFIVEMGLERKTAKVQINSKTKEIKEYEIQEGEVKNGSMFSKLKLPIILVMLVGISLAALKMIGAF
jgi:hypothetical protein